MKEITIGGALVVLLFSILFGAVTYSEQSRRECTSKLVAAGTPALEAKEACR